MSVPDSTQDDLTTASAPAEGRWTFDADVAKAFDDMLARSIPNYEDMRRFVSDAAVYFLKRAGTRMPLAVDLGASRGAALQPILDRFGARGTYAACDVSEPMIEACLDRFEGWVDAGVLRVFRHDLRDGYPTQVGVATVILGILTLQFVPIEYRPNLLGSIHENLAPGGAFLLVEKVMGGTRETDDLMRTLYYDGKAEQGYSQEAIERKRLSLEGVLVPLTAEFNETMLMKAGFAHVEQVWAWGPFRGWVAMKR